MSQLSTRHWFQCLLALICGLIFNAAFPPISLWVLALSLLPLFYFVCLSETVYRAFALGFYFGLGFFALHLFWLPNSLSSGNLFGPIGWVIFPPIVLIEAVFYGLITGSSRAFGKGQSTLSVLPALWLLMEWARTQGPLAFPWGSLGYTWSGTAFAQAADIAGSYGLSLFTLVLIALFTQPFVYRAMRGRFERPWLPLISAVVLLGFTFGYGLMRLNQAPPVPDKQALLVQGNTDPLGRAQGISNDLDVYTRLTREAMAQLAQKPSLVIWPEGAVINGNVEGIKGEETRKRIQESAGQATVITGASVWESTDDGLQGFNAVYGLADTAVTDRYDKIYLVPFGEGIPFARAFRPVYSVVYGWFGLSPYGRTAGQVSKPIETPLLRAAAYICYESVFPQVAKRMVKEGGQVLVNISNDAWFGKGNGAEQHFAMGAMRAIETRRYLLRVGNDGVTAAIDPLGKTLERLERGVEGSLVADYALMEGQTLYVRYGHMLIGLVMVYIVFALAIRLRQA